jgi:acyl carrier protein
MDRDQVKAKVLEVVSEFVADEKKATMTLESRLQEDLGLDSLDAAKIILKLEILKLEILKLEEECDVDVPDSASSKISTVGDVVNLICEMEKIA